MGRGSTAIRVISARPSCHTTLVRAGIGSEPSEGRRRRCREGTMTSREPAKRRQAIRSLGEAARFLEAWVPTLRRWICDGCPVAEKGIRGRPYQLDLIAVAAWRKGQLKKERKAAEDRAARDAELRLELLSDGAVTEGVPDAAAMTPEQRDEWLRDELAKVRLTRLRGELVPADEARDRLTEALALFRHGSYAGPTASH